jgi:hypothetical protein
MCDMTEPYKKPKLKPCPFCGELPKYDFDKMFDGTPRCITIECINKKCYLFHYDRMIPHRTFEEAAEYWNRRNPASQWTKEPPTEDGYYLSINNYGLQIVAITETQNILIVDDLYTIPEFQMQNPDCLWCDLKITLPDFKIAT